MQTGNPLELVQSELVQTKQELEATRGRLAHELEKGKSLTRQLTAVTKKGILAEAEVEILEMAKRARNTVIMDQTDEIKALQTLLNQLSAELDTLKAIPVDAIIHVFRYCEFMGWGAVEAEASFRSVEAWLISRGEDPNHIL